MWCLLIGRQSFFNVTSAFAFLYGRIFVATVPVTVTMSTLFICILGLLSAFHSVLFYQLVRVGGSKTVQTAHWCATAVRHSSDGTHSGDSGFLFDVVQDYLYLYSYLHLHMHLYLYLYLYLYLPWWVHLVVSFAAVKDADARHTLQIHEDLSSPRHRLI